MSIPAGWIVVAAACLALVGAAGRAAGNGSFTRLVPAETPKIVAAAEAFSASYPAASLFVPQTAGERRAEYASRGLGVRTFVDFDFGRAVTLGGFRHVQRRTTDTVAEADLLFSDSADFRTVHRTVHVVHVDEPGAVTVVAFPPVAARYVRWQVTTLREGRTRNPGGQAVEFFQPAATDPTPVAIRIDPRTPQVIERRDGTLTRRLQLTVDYPYAEPATALLRVEGQAERSVGLAFGRQVLDYVIPAEVNARSLAVEVALGGRMVAARTVAIPAIRPLTVYVLPHSHTDIGYTAIQTDIEEKQINNLLLGLAEARRTADYPAGARFVWNVEVMWAADLLLQRLGAGPRDEFFAALRRGQIALNGMYLNELTGLCRPEELVRLFRYAAEFGERTGTKIDSAMISDVPGYTWGTVTAMAQAGIRYFSVAPNYFDRIGTILVEWENKPFWWVGPDGRSRVLVWIPFWGYAMSHRYRTLSPQLIEEFCDALEARRYPYDVTYVRWSGHGDNAEPDARICDFIRDWNATHVSPQFVISSTSEAFREFERRHGAQLPEVRGDWTPYWEDGAGSSAAETALNRASSERLNQAEALWAMLAPAQYPRARFTEAWNNVLLYSEHTWGAHCSVTQPANPFTLDQWAIKQTYATTANLQSRQLLGDAARVAAGPTASRPTVVVDVYNTSSWTRSEVALVPHELSGDYTRVTDDRGQPVPSQRLASRELALLVRDLPPYSGRRFTLSREPRAAPEVPVKVSAASLDNGRLRVRLDESTGGIAELRAQGMAANLAESGRGPALNEYLYFQGDDPGLAQRSGPAKIAVRDRGPLVASLLVESEAPGCHGLRREVKLVAGADHVELHNTVDKRRLVAADYRSGAGKESVSFAFPFHVPGGEMRLEVPFGVFRPERDQIPSACKNWLTVGRWADVAAAEHGVTWVTLDTPLVQLGGLSANLLNSQTDPAVWRRVIEPTQAIYPWVMNNHWGTNYRAYQEGPVTFRFALRPHRGTTIAEASRFATGLSQPLVVVPGRGPAPGSASLLRVQPAEVLVTALKPCDKGQGFIVRLWNASEQTVRARLAWGRPGAEWFLSDTSEGRRQPANGEVEVPPFGLVTLRVETPAAGAGAGAGE
ncbi:MAG: hypothetical protein HZC55_25060 [Verrucomicrobia bacterium]|nr:hypothetical protein [Verrucomicrobiota bacterium]